MNNYQKIQLDSITNVSPRQVCLPISVEYFIPEDDLVRLIDQILERIDYTSLYQTYSTEGRNPEVAPKTLFKIMVYAYTQSIYSTRKIEQACRVNLCFRYLLEREPVPDHNTISRFRSKHLNQCIEDLFSQLVAILAEMKEVDFGNVFIDGTKIEANANKYTFVWKKAVEKNEARLQEKAREFLEKELGLHIAVDYLTAEYMNKILKLLHNEIKRQKIVFVYGTGCRKSELQRQYEQLTDFVKRQSKYEQYGRTFCGRNSFSKTDRDATFMHLKDDHMRNSQLKPAYNVQIGVESEYITGVMISSDRSDMNTLVPFLEKMKKQHEQQYRSVTADAGYESEENYRYLRDNGITSYIKPSNYEYSKTKKFQKDMEFRLAMKYDEDNDTYTCKNGRKLSYDRDKSKATASGYVTHSKIYKCESCENCPHLGTCYKGKYSKTMQVNPAFDELRKESLKNITSEEGILLRVNRSIQAEGVFGVTKQDMGFQRFLTRGNVNVSVEYMLLAFGYNLKKLSTRIRDGRTGQKLFIPENLAESV